MKILTWNMAGAGFHTLATHDQAWDWLLNQAEFDIALLQEAVVPSGLSQSFASILFQQRFLNSRIGWGNCVLSRDVLYENFIPTVNQQWSSSVHGPSLIAKPVSDGPWLVNIHSSAKHIPEFNVDDFTALGGMTCHSKRVWEIEVIAHELKETLSEKEFVLGGDLNSALLFDTVYKRSTNKRLWANLQSQGFYDLRFPHFDEEQQTFFRKDTNPYQLDHLFGSKSIQSKTNRWEVISAVVTDLNLSDHAPVKVEIDL